MSRPGPGTHGAATYVPVPYYDRDCIAAWSAAAGDHTGWNPHSVVLLSARPVRHRSGWVAAAVALLGLAAATVYVVTGSGSPVPVAPTAGVSYRSAAGHFAAVFPATPVEQGAVRTFGPVTITTRIAADRASHSAVEELELSRAVSPAEADGFVAGMLAGLTRSGGLVLDSQRRTAFRAHVARVGDLHAADGRAFTSLAVVWSAHRSYVLLAPAASFAAFSASFAPLP